MGLPALEYALPVFTDPLVVGLIVLGTIVGVIVGALPGLSSSMAIALLLPFSLYLEPVPAIALLAALYCAGTFGGSITAILINAPGAKPHFRWITPVCIKFNDFENPSTLPHPRDILLGLCCTN